MQATTAYQFTLHLPGCNQRLTVDGLDEFRRNHVELQLDARDAETAIERMAQRDDSADYPKVGDFVRFSDGTMRRISCHWTDGTGWDGGCQTSDLYGLHSGRYYLGDGYCNFSGGLHPAVPTEQLKPTDEFMLGAVWMFRHDHWTAHNGVDFTVPFPVWEYDGQPTL